VDIDDSSGREIVDEFCYLGNMLSVNRDSDAAVTARICSGWFNFRSLASFVTTNDVTLWRGKVYDACIRSGVLHGRENWSLKRENELALHRAETRMTIWMCGVKLRDKLYYVDFRQQLRIDDIVKWYKEIDC